MSDNESTEILLAIGAALDKKSFEEALKLFEDFKKKFSDSLGKGLNESSVKGFQKQLESAIMGGMSDSSINNLVSNFKKLSDRLGKMIAEALDAGEPVSKGKSSSSKLISSVESDLKEFEARVDRIYKRYGHNIGKKGFMGDAFKDIFQGGDDSKYIDEYLGNMQRLIVAEKEFEKWMAAHHKMQMQFDSWGENTTYQTVRSAVAARKVSFDKDTGFSSQDYMAGAKVLGISSQELFDINKKREQRSASIDKAVKLQDTQYYQKLGISANTSTLAEQELAGNITISSRSMKIHNEEALKALGISENLAIKNRLLSSSFEGTGKAVQDMSKKYEKLDANQKLAADSLGFSMEDPISSKKALKAVVKASEEVGTSNLQALKERSVKIFNDVKEIKTASDRFITEMELKYSGSSAVIKRYESETGSKDFAKSLSSTYSAASGPNMQRLGLATSDSESIYKLNEAKNAGNISLTANSLKIHNEEGLKAVGVTEHLAASMGILSNKFQSSSAIIQKLEVELSQLSEVEKQAFSAINPDKTNINEFKTALEAVRETGKRAWKEGVIDPVKIASMAVDEFAKKAAPTQEVTKKSAYDKKYESSSMEKQFAMDAAVFATHGDTEELKAWLAVMDKVEKALSTQTAKLRAAGKDADAYRESNNILITTLGVLSGSLKITKDGIEGVIPALSDAEKLIRKYSGESAGFQSGLQALIADNNGNVNTEKFKSSFSLLTSANKDIESTVAKMKSLGKSSEEINKFVSSIDVLTLAFKKEDEASKVASHTISEIKKEFAAAEKPSTLLSRSITDLYEKFKILSGYAISGSIAYGLGNMFREAVINVVKYDQALHDLKAITDSSTAQMHQMGATILDVSANSKFKILEIAETMKILGQAGLTATESIATIGPIVKLATATLSDLKTTTDLVTSVMEAFDIPFADTSKVIDVFGAAMNKSKLNIEGMKTAFSYVGPVAHSAGMSLEDLSAAMSILANSGLKFSTIGTSLKEVIDKLLNPSKEFSEAIARAGMSVQDFNPATNEFATIISRLSIVVPDTATALEYFGNRGATAIAALTTSGSSGFKKMAEGMTDVGSVSKMAAEQLLGLEVQLDQARSRLEVFGIKAGEVFGAKNIIETFTSAFSSMLSAIINWDGPVANLTKGFIQLFTILGTGVIVLKTVQANFALLTGEAAKASLSVQVLSTSLSTMWNTLKGLFTLKSLGIGLVIMAVTTGLSYLIEKLSDTRSETDKLLEKQNQHAEVLRLEKEKTDILTGTAEKYKRTIEDAKAPLEDRIVAYRKLADMGADVDTSTISNIRTIDQFGETLDRNKGKIDSYIEKLRQMGANTRTAILNAAAADLSVGEKAVEDINININKTKTSQSDFGSPDIAEANTFTKSTAEEQKKKLEDLNNWQKANEDNRNKLYSFVDNYLKSNKVMSEKLKTAAKSGDSSSISSAVDSIIQSMMDDGTISKNGDSGAIERMHAYAINKANEMTETAEAISVTFAPNMEKLNKDVQKNAAKNASTAEENIKKIGSSLRRNTENIQTELNKELESLRRSGKYEDNDPNENDDNNPFTVARKRAQLAMEKQRDDAQKMVNDQIKSIDALNEDSVAFYKSKTDGEIAKLEAAGKSKEAAEKREQLEIQFAENELSVAKRTYELQKNAGVLSEKAERDWQKALQDKETKLNQALARKNKTLAQIDKSDAASQRKEVTEMTKSLADQYKDKLATLDAEEAAKLADTRINDLQDTRKFEEDSFVIKEEFAAKRIALAKWEIEEQKKIKAAGGRDTLDSRGKADLEKEKKDQVNTTYDKNYYLKMRAYNDALEERNALLDKAAILLTGVKNAHVRAVKEEELNYKKSLILLEDRLNKGEILYSNYLIERDNLTAQHNQAQEDLSGKWSEGITRGFDSFINSVGTWADQVQSFTDQSLGYLSDQLADLALTGKTDFQDMVNSMLKDLTKLSANKLLQSLLGGEDAGQGTGKSYGILGGGIKFITDMFGGGSENKDKVSASNNILDNLPKATSTMSVNAGVVNINGASSGGGISSLFGGTQGNMGNGSDAASLAKAEQVSQLTESIETQSTGFFSNMWDSISGFFTDMGGGLKDMFSGLWSSLSGLFGGGAGSSSGGGGLFSMLSGAMSLFGFADGGEIPGFSPNSRADNILAWTTAGEFVHPVPTVNYYGKGTMEAIRTRSIPREVFSGYSHRSAKSGGTHYADGGTISGSGAQVTTEQEKQKMPDIVNILDGKMMEEYLGSRAGTKMLLNVMSRNPNMFNNALKRG